MLHSTHITGGQISTVGRLVVVRTRSVSWLVTNTFALEPLTQPVPSVSKMLTSQQSSSTVPRLSKLWRLEIPPPENAFNSAVV